MSDNGEELEKTFGLDATLIHVPYVYLIIFLLEFLFSSPAFFLKTYMKTQMCVFSIKGMASAD